MSKKAKGNKYLFSVLFLILVMAVTVYVLLKETNLEEMWNLVLSVDLKYIIFGAVLVVLFFAFGGASVSVVLNSLDNKTPLHKSFVYTCVNEFYSFITPFGSGGQPFTIYYMMHDGIPGTKVSISTLVSLLEYKLVMLVYSIIIVIFRPSLVFGHGPFVIALFLLSALINILMVLLIFFSMYNRTLVRNIGKWSYKLLAKFGIVKKEQLEAKIEHFNGIVEDYHNGAMHLKHHPFIFVKSFFCSFAQRGAMFLVSLMVFLSFGMNPSMWFDVLAAQALIYIAVDSLPLPGGVGITETLFMAIYSTIYAANMITPAVLLTRVLNYVFALIVSGFFSFYKQITAMKGKKELDA